MIIFFYILFTKKSINTRLKVATDQDELAVLKQAIKLMDAESRAKSKMKKLQEALDLATFKKYSELSDAECQRLIVEDKWLAHLERNIVAEIERVTQQLANRVKELEERYAKTLPAIEKSVDRLSEKVEVHLKAMGLEWAR